MKKKKKKKKTRKKKRKIGRKRKRGRRRDDKEELEGKEGEKVLSECLQMPQQLPVRTEEKAKHSCYAEQSRTEQSIAG